MSVSNFIKKCFDSDLDFSCVEIDDFIVCVKRLSQILNKASDDSKKSTRERKMNSVLAQQVFLSERFNPKTVHDYYSFTYENEQIDVCIKSKSFCVSVTGDFVPTAESIMHVLRLDNFNFDNQFDYTEVNNFVFNDSKFTYFGGDSNNFPLNEVGLKRICRVWSTIVNMYLSHIQERLNV